MNWPDRPTDQSIGPKNVADAAHKPSAVPVRTPMSKIIIFCDKSNTNNKTLYKLYVIPRFMK
jgi:hypothetical protein